MFYGKYVDKSVREVVDFLELENNNIIKSDIAIVEKMIPFLEQIKDKGFLLLGVHDAWFEVELQIPEDLSISEGEVMKLREDLKLSRIDFIVPSYCNSPAGDIGCTINLYRDGDCFDYVYEKNISAEEIPDMYSIFEEKRDYIKPYLRGMII